MAMYASLLCRLQTASPIYVALQIGHATAVQSRVHQHSIWMSQPHRSAWTVAHQHDLHLPTQVDAHKAQQQSTPGRGPGCMMPGPPGRGGPAPPGLAMPSFLPATLTESTRSPTCGTALLVRGKSRDQQALAQGVFVCLLTDRSVHRGVAGPSFQGWSSVVPDQKQGSRHGLARPTRGCCSLHLSLLPPRRFHPWWAATAHLQKRNKDRCQQRTTASLAPTPGCACQCHLDPHAGEQPAGSYLVVVQ